jgi:hypothetical protein
MVSGSNSMAEMAARSIRMPDGRPVPDFTATH